ncbi:MAG: thermonuclease family protein [Bacteroidetes bacterium]|nr:thermonuclease family protein [Bacteroidota bacterium]
MQVRVKKILSGDRFLTDNGLEVKLIGINTPPKDDSLKIDELSQSTGINSDTIKLLGALCAEFTENYLKNEKVFLVKDINNEDTDSTGKISRYVFLDDGTMFNKTILLYGYAFVNPDERNSFREWKDFSSIMLYIRSYFLGLWINPNFRKLQPKL